MDPSTHTEQALADFREAEAAVIEAEQRLATATERLKTTSVEVLAAIHEMRSRSDEEATHHLMAIIRHIYWHQPRIPARELARVSGFGNLNAMLAAIGPVPSGIPCNRCGAQLMRTSRSWGPNTYGPPLCSACSKLKTEMRSRAANISRLRQRMVDESKVAADVRDLRVAATLVMAYPPFGTGVPLGDDQHGFWSGWENAKHVHDGLIRLGAADDELAEIGCASVRRLVKSATEVVGWDVARTRDLVDPITSEPAHAVLARLGRLVKETSEAATARAAAVYGAEYEPSPEEIRGLWDEPSPLLRLR